MGLIDASSNKVDLPLCTFPWLKGIHLMWKCVTVNISVVDLLSSPCWIVNICIQYPGWILTNMHTRRYSVYHCISRQEPTAVLSSSAASTPSRVWILEFLWVSLQNFSAVIRKIRFYYVPFPSPITWDNHGVSGTKQIFRHISQLAHCIILSSLVWWEWKRKLSLISNQFVALESCLNTCMHTHCNVK